MKIAHWDTDELGSGELCRISVGVSVLVHILFIMALSVWRVPDITAVFNRPTPVFRVTPVHMERPQVSRHQVVQNYLKSIQFDNPLAVPRGSKSSQTEPPEEIKAPAGDSGPARTALSQPSKIAVDEAQAFKEKVIVVPRKVDTSVEMRVFETAQAAPFADETSDLGLPEAFSEKMAAFTPSRSSGVGRGQETVKDFKGLGGTGRYGSLDRFVEISVSTWRDPATGTGYFEVRLTPGKDAAKLPHMPKELVFLIDASLSINENRIKEFKKGIVHCLKNLNEGDRVNIVTFKETVTPFAPSSVAPGTSTVADAIRFMNKLEPSRTTDIYAAFLANMTADPGMLPSYIFFMSDGRPTHGETSSARIIEEISRKNALGRSFFSFSGGKRVNRYLLDFLSYQNRGWSEYAASGNAIAGRISEFYDKIRDPLLRNLRFQFSQIDEREVYPKHLPDLFRNAEFVIYGTYRDEKPFSLQLLGEIGGEVKEIILAGDLAKASPGTGEIAKNWAFNKIYHLISRMTMEGPKEELKAEVRELSRRYGIRTPYDIAD